MGYIITDSCVMCGACAAQCPVEAIHEGEDKYEIDQDVCIGCGSCEATCPMSAIESE